MRPAPVNAPAAMTLPEFAESLPDTFRHTFLHIHPVNRIKQAITGHTAREGTDSALQIEAGDHLNSLMPAAGLAYPIAVSHCVMLQQPAVTRQQNTPLLTRDPHQLSIARRAAIYAVETKHAEDRRQFSQMHIEHKLWLS